MSKRIDELKLSIREGELRLMDRKQKGKEAIERNIYNCKIRLERITTNLPEGEMIYKDDRWMYKFGK